MTIEQAVQKDFICKICVDTITRAGICRECSNRLGFTEELSLESVMIETLCYFFGDDIKKNRRILLGGQNCKTNIDGDCDEKPKGAYIDLPLLSKDVQINIEMDENGHKNYSVSCELKRYDTVRFGSEDGLLRKQLFIRLNPTKSEHIPYELVDRLKVLVELCYRHLEEQVSDDDKIGVHIIYLFYPDDNPHQQMASSSSMTLKTSDINDLSILLRPKIEVFKLEDLEKDKIDDTASRLRIEKQEIAASKNCCSALNYPTIPKKRKRCSQFRSKDSLLCKRHKAMDERYKTTGVGNPIQLVEDNCLGFTHDNSCIL